jgi:hypothetical protein
VIPQIVRENASPEYCPLLEAFGLALRGGGVAVGGTHEHDSLQAVGIGEMIATRRADGEQVQQFVVVSKVFGRYDPVAPPRPVEQRAYFEDSTN